MADTMKLSIDTGIETVEIENELGEVIGSFKFNPSDVNMAYRIETAAQAINDREIDEEKLKDVTSAEFKEFCDFLGQQFDYVLGFDVVDGIFAKVHMLTPVRNGDFYFEQVFDGIAGYVEKATKQRVNKRLAKIRKATVKYKK